MNQDRKSDWLYLRGKGTDIEENLNIVLFDLCRSEEDKFVIEKCDKNRVG